ncbi:hypothetical protein [Lacinutrix sp.]|uniref:hypothetical protein n=1 Tax=Lacinutrix sp. TaxID=1937692 RepID=UPI0025C2A3AE|nr:hypothetical protein [Lacinutrix sp.]
MKLKKVLLDDNACSENLHNMKFARNNRLCMKCDTVLPDLTETSLQDIANNHYGKNKCVILRSDQVEFLIYYKKIKTFALASSLFIGTTFINLAFAQTVEKQIDSCLITGTAIGKEKNILADRQIYFLIKDSDSIYETRTNNKGEFVINLPKNCEIDFSNVKKMISKKTRNRKSMTLSQNLCKLKTQD